MHNDDDDDDGDYSKPFFIGTPSGNGKKRSQYLLIATIEKEQLQCSVYNLI